MASILLRKLRHGSEMNCTPWVRKKQTPYSCPYIYQLSLNFQNYFADALCSITRLNSTQTGRYSIYLPRRDGRLSWHRWLVHAETVTQICWSTYPYSPWPWFEETTVENLTEAVCNARVIFSNTLWMMLSLSSFRPGPLIKKSNSY